ncbi:MAG: dioxygenase [SAR324 cluster bacterium]|uniref:Dioxygenase n=1 Tax=SAR324 cluster bacterium TaxID=2024889 RepID=A0A2A4ST37_9DELT|nr:MAG: dioxygenase [SAR324 cluster bacterium]
MSLMPVGFVSHNAPLMALQPSKGLQLLRWGNTMVTPKSILVVSAHWVTSYPTLGSITSRSLMYDFFGFPEELYAIKYPAPGALEIADKVKSLIEFQFGRCEQEKTRAWDHGVWIPLMHMYPKADIPILQLSLPSDLSPKELFLLGETLSSLRHNGTLILCSGAITHNFQELDWEEKKPLPQWAAEFDQWIEETLVNWDMDELLKFQTVAPGFSTAHPTWEHFTPLLIAAGAANKESHEASFPITGFEYSSLSRRCIQFS